MLNLLTFATHNRAGEITYKHLGNNRYEITVTTYTKAESIDADRCELTVFFGDGTSEVVRRSNGPNSSACGGSKAGVLVAPSIKKNIYRTIHLYSGSGYYRITMEDPNRNGGIINIVNSDSQVFALESELIILDGLGGRNSSPVLTNPPIDNGSVFRPFEHNPGAVDHDISISGRSDSLSYELVSCLGINGEPIDSYQFPNEISPGTNNAVTLDPKSGTFEWVSPQLQGEYNIAIKILEYRLIGTVWIKVGSILRDMQITIGPSTNNQPNLLNVKDDCIIASKMGTPGYRTEVKGEDSDGDKLVLSATGDPFFVSPAIATFPIKTAVSPISQFFDWGANCRHVRSKPYMVVYRLSDSIKSSPNVQLIDYEVAWYTVIAPPISFQSAVSNSNGIDLTWQGPECAENVVGLKLYRRENNAIWTPSRCSTGIPVEAGYELINTFSDITQTSYFDNKNGEGLEHGIKYCYRIVYYYKDGSESIASNEVCTELKKDVPVLTRANVNSTDVSTGSDTVMWFAPTELDPSVFPGPYQYKLSRKTENGSFQEIWQSPIDALIADLPTVFVDQNLNTESEWYFYRIQLFSNGNLVGGGADASVPRLKIASLDKRMRLSWDLDVPWEVDSVAIYKKNASGIFEEIAVTVKNQFTDTNVVNGDLYCYYVKTYGAYSGAGYPEPLINLSQDKCAVPKDEQEPCSVIGLVGEGDCTSQGLSLSWKNPNIECDTTNDVASYRIYRRPDLSFSVKNLFAEVQGAFKTSYSVDNLSSIAGCYYITAVDSVGNESSIVDSVCLDNCPYYELPNVFTPGGDGYNDLFVPFPDYRFVKEVDMKIFNRWGRLVFETTDPDIRWDGKDKDSGQLSNAGTFFFVCVVKEIRLRGVQERVIKGHVTLILQNRIIEE